MVKFSFSKSNRIRSIEKDEVLINLTRKVIVCEPHNEEIAYTRAYAVDPAPYQVLHEKP
jgi:hypothetical protein